MPEIRPLGAPEDGVFHAQSKAAIKSPYTEASWFRLNDTAEQVTQYLVRRKVTVPTGSSTAAGLDS